MIKQVCTMVLCFLYSCTVAFACTNALPTNNAGFCSSFKTAATCYCTSSSFPAGMCQDMEALYNRMMGVFGSLEKACAFQKYTDPQDCIDNWNCYRKGGHDSQKRLCSATGKSCK